MEPIVSFFTWSLIPSSVGELYEYALLPEHLTSCDPSIYTTTVTDTGALSVSSGIRTGRSPKDKRVVLDDVTKDVSILKILII